MEEIDLTRLFAGNAPTVRAQRIFADRNSEQEAFDLALQVYASDLKDLNLGSWEAQDLDRPRRNIMTFYGIGGIGKSTLLQMLVQRLDPASQPPSHWPARPPLPLRFVVASADLRRSAMPTLEGLLLDIRSALAPTTERFIAFDLLFGTYWVQNHPNNDLRSFLQRRTTVSRVSDLLGLPDHIEAAVGDLASELSGISAIGSSLARSTRTVLNLIKDRRLAQHALGECRLLEQLLQSPPTQETLSYTPYALAWDLSRVQRKNPLGLVILLDTFEEVDPDFEALIQRMIWLLPNALFVLAGRNRVRWGDDIEKGSQFRAGASSWPGLTATAPDEPRQHLVGYLNADDAKYYLEQSLSSSASNNVVAAAVRAAAGLPLHLDLVVQRWAQISSSRPPTVEDVSVSFPELARNVFRDLSPEERRAIFACCLFDAFDVDLIRRAAGLPISGPVLRLFDRPLISERPDLPLPRALHDALRQTLLQARDLDVDQWSYADWRAAAERGLAELRSRCDTASDIGFFALQAFSIARTFDVRDPWLADIANRLTSRSVWNPAWKALRLPYGAEPPTDSRSWVAALADSLTVIMGRQIQSRHKVASELAKILARADDPDGRLDVVRYFFAEAARDAGMLEESRATLRDVLARKSPLAIRAVHGLLHLLRREGQFREYDNLLTAHADRLRTPERLRGELLWTQGRFTDAATQFRLGFDRAAQASDQGEAGLCAAYEAYVLAFTVPDAVVEPLARANEYVGLAPLSFTYVMTRIAEALSRVGTQVSRQIISDARRTAVQASHTSLVAYADLVEVFDAAICRDEDKNVAVKQRLQNQVRGKMFTYLVEIAEAISGNPQSVAQSDWTDNQWSTRWSEAVSKRREMDRG